MGQRAVPPIIIPPPPPIGLGHNDEDGHVYCHLCDWVAGPFASIERIEHELRQHLLAAHGRHARYRIDHEGKRVDIPD